MTGVVSHLGQGLEGRVTHMRRRVWWVGQRLRQLRQTINVEYQPGQGPIDLDALISPLRFDVVVREDFIRTVRADWDRYQRDVESLVRDAMSGEYYFWFRSVAVQHVGVHPQDAEGLQRAFRRRVRRTVRLIEAFDRSGFDPAFPLVLRAATALPTETGKHLGRRVYPLDGCHRLALLHLSGVQELPAPYYRLIETSLPPLDNTLPLIRALNLDAPRYYRFLARGFGVEPCDSREQLLDLVRDHDPQRLGEVENVLAVDEPALLVPGGPSSYGVTSS